MPGRNIEKVYVEDSFYHVYNRGLGKMDIFRDSEDYAVFLNLFKRTLGQSVEFSPKGYEYPNYHNDLELVAYCLMPNHFHLLIRTKNKPMAMPELLKSVLTAYVMYFNKKHARVGPLFGKRYRAVRIVDDAQLWHITRYIHMNPLDIGTDYKRYKYSSLQNYLGSKSSDWLIADEVVAMFEEEGQDYLQFLQEYEGKKAELEEMKRELY